MNRLQRSQQQVLAVDLGGTKVAVAVVNRNGRILSRLIEPVDTSSPVAPVNQIVGLAERLGGKFAAGAVAVPGLVRRNGTVWAPNLPGWERMPLAARLQRRLGIPFAVESDRAAALLGETWCGAARGKSDAVVLIIGTGIGAGIISGGTIVRGAHELAGCAGWLIVTDCDNECVRSVGQLEALAAGPAMARAAQSETMTARDVAAAARAGDHHAREIFHRAGELLGRGIANIISLFDPEVVILGGGMAEAADLYLQELRASVSQWAQPLAAPKVKIAVSRLGGDADLLGAARIAWDLLDSTRRKPRP